MRHVICPTGLAIAGMLAGACAGNRVPVFVAPSNQSIEAGSEMSFGGDGHVVYVDNHSSVAIMVTGLQLIDCENIKNSCEVQRLRIQVPAGQRTNIATVKPENPNRPYSFQFHYSWEPLHQQ
ncbi:MAG TPA: hypothetical protein VF919_02620 [Gemmatimonadales bacterium]